MNDDFLHRIRVEPPAGFMTSLKARLDRQLPPAPAAPRSSLFRVLAFGLLFGGSVFAISLLTVNGLPDFARNFAATSHQGSTQKPDSPGQAATPARLPGGSRSTPLSATQGPTKELEAPGSARNSDRSTGVPGPTSNTAAPTQPINGGTSADSRQVINVVTPKDLQEYIERLAEEFGQPNGFGMSVTPTDTSTEALARLCATTAGSVGNKAPLLIASVPRRITRTELDVCTRNIGNISELQFGHQAIVLARSRLYGTLALSPRDIFLAVAAEIPDPEHPDTFIANPNTTWNQVNGAMENESIEVFGPPAKSLTGIAFRQILFEAGCNSFPAIAALRPKDSARHERVCGTFRKDAAYVELPESGSSFELFERLQSHPNTVGVIAYGLFQAFGSYPQSSKTVAAMPIGGIEPTRETILAGSYPGSRALYLYVDQRRALGSTYWIARFMEGGHSLNPAYSVIPPQTTQIQAILNAYRLPDLKL